MHRLARGSAGMHARKEEEIETDLTESHRGYTDLVAEKDGQSLRESKSSIGLLRTCGKEHQEKPRIFRYALHYHQR